MKEQFRGPITWRLFRGLHINNPGLLQLFGFVMGGGIEASSICEIR